MSVVSKDPYADLIYVKTFARPYNFIPLFIETVANLAKKGFRKFGKQIYGSKVAVIGLAYKKNLEKHHVFHSIKGLVNPGAEIQAYKPPFPSIMTKCRGFVQAGSECALFMVWNHDHLFRRISAETLKRLIAPRYS